MFATMDTDIGSQLPLWAVQDDGIPGVNTVDTFMGGWTSAAAKQYSLSESSQVPFCECFSDELDRRN